ncbi:MAG: hypothetical protein DWQ06_06255 [Calditrichaeota bacterium]|nr:MAG: hypothetical protein DWQ06_06255 [Calditrichota bacterium]
MFITKILKSEVKTSNSSSFSAAAVGQFPKEFQLTFGDRFDKGFILIFIILFLIFMPITGWLSTIGPPEVSLDDYEDLLAQYTETVLDIEPAEVLEEEPEEAAGIDEGTGEEEAGEEEATESEQEVAANEQSGPTAEQVQERRKQRLASQRAAASAAASSAAAEAAAGVGVFKELVGKGGGYGGAASAGGLSAGAAGGAGGGLDAVLSQVGGVKSGSGSSSLGGGGGTLGGAGGLGALGGGAGGGKGIGGGTAAGSLKGSGKIGNLKPPRVKGKAAKNAYRNPNAIASVMNSYQAAVQFCYETEKRVNPKLKGKISIVFDIIESGRVKGARIKSSSMRNRKVESCILRNVKKWKFEEIDSGSGAVSVERTYIFQ